ncbi:MAG: hypothetical protein DHS20C12_28560 [Pseudohongiella sp.]|nr:MAG: hypothetical protein DHS20C12_28560 [Pseudohongiella sp.]
MVKSKSIVTSCFALLFGLAGCASDRLQIGNALTLCCPGNYSQYQNYAIQLNNLPTFLSDYVVGEFDLAFQELGLDRNDRENDLVVTLSYEHVNLNPEQQDIDPLVRSASFTEDLRYIAVIDISMRESATGTVVWGGKISRIHTVAPGEYMHENAARMAFRQTFRNLLKGYPATAPQAQ